MPDAVATEVSALRTSRTTFRFYSADITIRCVLIVTLHPMHALWMWQIYCQKLLDMSLSNSNWIFAMELHVEFNEEKIACAVWCVKTVERLNKKLHLDRSQTYFVNRFQLNSELSENSSGKAYLACISRIFFPSTIDECRGKGRRIPLTYVARPSERQSNA